MVELHDLSRMYHHFKVRKYSEIWILFHYIRVISDTMEKMKEDKKRNFFYFYCPDMRYDRKLN